MDSNISPAHDAAATKKRVLIVGAGGFAGASLVAESISRGYETWAGVRATTSRKWLSDPAIKFIEFDFDHPASLAESMEMALPGKKWDWIVYNLGATKVTSYADFSRINYDYLRYFTEALKKADKVPSRLLYMSSLSALGPGDEKGYTPYTEEMIPHPNTRYGASKLKAEMWLLTAGIPYIIFRATGIYGPRDHDYFLMFDSIKKGFDFSVGFRRQMLTFIYVDDLARAVYDALAKSPADETYLISEPRAYTQKEFRKLSKEALGKRFVLPLSLPLGIVRGVSFLAEKWGVMRLKPSTLNRDKFRIMKQRNWCVDISKAQKAFGFSPRVSLREGIGKAIEWYKKEGWLK